MYWLLASVSAVLTGIAIIVLPDDEPDPSSSLAPRSPVRAGTRGPVTASDLRTAELPLARRGYDPGVVDALLERLARQLDDDRDVLAGSSGEELEESSGDLAGGLDR